MQLYDRKSINATKCSVTVMMYRDAQLKNGRRINMAQAAKQQQSSPNDLNRPCHPWFPVISQNIVHHLNNILAPALQEPMFVGIVQ